MGRWRCDNQLPIRRRQGAFSDPRTNCHDKQGAHVFRLNAGIPLARMLAEGGRREEAKSVLDHAAAITLDEWDGPETAIATQLRSDLH